jgi:hypothetical protein
MTTTRGTTLTTTMWVVNRVHHNAANMWALAKPSITASFTNFDILLIWVGYRANGRHTLRPHQTNFTRSKAQDSVPTIAANQLNISPSRTRKLATLTGL